MYVVIKFAIYSPSSRIHIFKRKGCYSKVFPIQKRKQRDKRSIRQKWHSHLGWCSILYGNDRHCNGVSLSPLPYISSWDLIRKVFPHATAHACGDVTLKPHPTRTLMLRTSERMCNDFMVLITENASHWLWLFACVYAVCLISCSISSVT